MGPRAVTVIAAGLGAVFALSHLLAVGSASGFVLAHVRYTDPAAVDIDVSRSDRHYGYDGQFMYRLAVKPFSTQERAAGVRFDEPAYRHQRIVYPVLAWAVSGGGRPALVPSVLVVVNLVAFAAVAGLGAAIATSYGRHAAWGLALAAHPGFLMAIARDLGEVVAAAFALAAVLALRRGHPALAGAALTSAVLTRETAMIYVAAMAVAWTLRRRGPAPAAWLPPIAVFVIWQVALISWWGESPREFARQNVGGFGGGLRDWFGLRHAGAFGAVEVVQMMLLVALVLYTARVIVRERDVSWEALAWSAAVVLLLFLNVRVWHVSWSWTRAATEVWILSGLVLMRSRSLRPLTLPLAPLWVASAVQVSWLWQMPGGS